MSAKAVLLLFLSFISPLFASVALSAEEPRSAPSAFFPVWKLMSQEEKEQFISGYIHGWRDAAKMTDIAINYVRENPEQALPGLQRIKSIYDMPQMSPLELAREIDNFFAQPENRDAPLSRAVSAKATK